MAPQLQIRLLGGLQIILHGAPLKDFVSNKVPALLAYLAVTQREHQREALAGLLWGERAEADARNNLRQSLSNLRRLLAQHLSITRDTAALSPDGGLFLDVAAFERLLQPAGEESTSARAARLREAVGLYQGDFLAGFSVRDAPEFEDWVLAQRTRLRELALHALHTLTQIRLGQGDAAGAIDSATRLLAIDSWREEAHRQLMLALARSGQRSAALAQYETCRRILAAALGVPPASETTDLYDRIVAARRRVQLPPAATPFVGRAQELDEVARLIADPTCRLINLSGPGGCGKSRLAHEAAARAADGFLHGVCFVPLAGAAALDVVPSTIADALGLALGGKTDPRDQLVAHLRDKELLLVLDNLEHLPGVQALLGHFMANCPEVRLLATSRERLNLYGERLVELGGLDVPPAAGGEPVGRFSAAQLFVNSARAARPGYDLQVEDESAIRRICGLVHGLPLALELAAAWVRHLTSHEIAGEIERSLSFLATAQTNVPARHRSLLAAFEHSWSLLAEAERQAFARLAVFRGGCEREAAQIVAQCGLPVLAALCDKSLLRRDPGGRYQLHELLRQFAESKLHAQPHSVLEAQARHCEHYIALAASYEDALSDARHAQARARLATEADNLRAAWGWALAQGEVSRLQPAVEGLRVFFEIMGWYAEAVTLFGAAAEAERTAAGPASPLHAQLLVREAWFHHRRDRFDLARPLIEQSLASLQTARPRLPAEEALCLLCLANMARAVGDFSDAREFARQSLELSRLHGNPRLIGASLNGLAVAWAELGEYQEAVRVHAECLALRRELGDQRGIATALVNLGFIGLGQGQHADTRRYLQEALAIFREMGYPMGEVVALNNLGAVHLLLGEHSAARPLLEECLALCRALGHQHIAAHAQANLGAVVGLLGDLEQAWQHIREAMQTSQAIGSDSAALLILLSGSILMRQQAQHEKAVETLTFVLAHPAANRETQNRAAQLLAEIMAALPESLASAAQARGRAQRMDVLAAGILDQAPLIQAPR